MADDQIFNDYLKKLREEKSEEEVEKFLLNLTQLSSAEVYAAMLSQLTEEDLTALDDITNEADAMEEINKRFQMRTGKTPKEFAIGLRDAISKGLLEEKHSTPNEDSSEPSKSSE